MTKLLVSVRTVQEAQAALACEIDVLDVKEPRLGSLGRAEKQVILAAADLAAEAGIPCSAALGELLDRNQGGFERDLNHLQFAKVGLAGAASRDDWEEHWRGFWSQAADGVKRVGVVYADWRRAESPDPDRVVAAAARLGCSAVLVDTFGKDRGGLLSHLCESEVRSLIRQSHDHGMWVVLAGSLDAGTAAQVADWGADMIAVRGAVCRGARTDDLDPARLIDLSRAVRGRGAPVTHTRLGNSG